VVFVGEVGSECRGDGVGEGEGGMLWNMVPASRWARTRHRSVGGELRDIMDSVGQWEYVVEMVRMYVLAIWPMYLGVFMIFWRWHTVSCAAWALREGRP
jgi:hypothetical protein